MAKDKAVITAILLILVSFSLTACFKTNKEPIALFTAFPTSGEAPLEVTFDASNSYDPDGSILSFKWNFRDGNTGNGETISHTFNSKGSYNVKLTVTDDKGATDSESKTITVIEPQNQSPTASFTANPTSGVAPLEVDFNASESSDPDGTIASYEWALGDGVSGSGMIISHNYENGGEYIAQLTVIDDDGASDTTSTNILVESGTKVGGILSHDSTWTVDQSPYIVVESVGIPEGVTLTINPGVEVRFSFNTQMQIEGTIKAVGTNSDPILFTDRSNANGWEGLDFLSTGSQNTSSKLIHCIFRNGGKAIDLRGGKNIPEIAHSTFEDGWFGVYSTSGYTGLSISISDCVMRDNVKGINVRIGSNGTLNVSECKITQNEVGVDLTWTFGKAYINNNNIHDNTEYNLKADHTVNSGEEVIVDATGNWWGTTNTSVIEEGIYDCNDDLEYGCVEYKPVANSPK